MTTRMMGTATVLAILVLTSVASAFQTETGTQDRLSALLAEAEAFATVTFNNAEALNRYQEAEKIAPENYAMLWGMSRSYVDIGEHLPGKTDEERNEQLKYYEQALTYANKAVTAHPKKFQGYLRRAIANGRIALFKGVWESLDLVKAVKADTEKAIELDPNDATAYYILGRTHAKVSEKPGIVRWPLGLSWASYEDAAKYYEKAIALRPDFIMYRLDAARTYAELEEYGKAKAELQAISSIADNDEDDPKFREEAKELAKVIEDSE